MSIGRHRMVKKLAPEVRRINLVAPTDLLRRIDKWMKAQPGFPPSRSEAIRHMIEQFLNAEAKDKKPK
jgi:metal-responsive CopG/Arc/MetJ family transcriptional regulator